MLAGQYAASLATTPLDSTNAELVAALMQGLHSGLDGTALCQKLVAMKGMSAQVFLYAMLAIPARLPDRLTACACLGRLYETAWPLNEACRQRLEDAVILGGVFKWMPKFLTFAIEVHHSVMFVFKRLHVRHFHGGHCCAVGNFSLMRDAVTAPCCQAAVEAKHLMCQLRCRCPVLGL